MSRATIKALVKIISRQPRLSATREQQLLKQYRDGDKSAVNELVTTHLRFVFHIARRYKSYGYPLADLVQEGTVGLLEALKRFNPEKRTRLSTYAMWWIRASIQDYVIRSRSLVKIGTTAAQRSLFFNLPRIMLDWHRDDAPPEDLVRNLATRFNTSVSDVLKFARRISRPDQSLNVPVKQEQTTLIERIVDERPDPEISLINKFDGRILLEQLSTALSTLPPRETFIIKRRFLTDRIRTRSDLGTELGVSKERVRQLEVRALTKLKELLKPLSKQEKLAG